MDVGGVCSVAWRGGSRQKMGRLHSGAFQEIDTAANQVAAGADQVSSGAQALSQGATEQASAVEELAATVQEINVKISQTAKDTDSANEITMVTGTKVNESKLKMQELVAAMEEIKQTSQQIQGIIKTIDDIAFQTNILALNAAVEAARAGAAGKGFAVVADEVRNLAGKSAEASRNTQELIQNSIQLWSVAVCLQRIRHRCWRTQQRKQAVSWSLSSALQRQPQSRRRLPSVRPWPWA